MRYIVLGIFLGMGFLLKAQQDPVFSFSQQQMTAINPAMAALDNNLYVQALVRSQWSDVASSPSSQLVSASMPIHSNMGLGLTISNDQVFIEKSTTIGIDYSYLVRLNEELNLQLGVKVLGNSFRINSSGLKVFDANPDNSLGNLSNFSLNVGTGAVLNHEKFMLGLAFPRLLTNNRLNERNGVGGLQNRNISFLYGQYKIETENGISIKPGAVARFLDSAPSTYDLSTFVGFGTVEAGLTWRVSQAISASALYHLKNGLTFGYAYEFATGNEFNLGGSHEFFVSYSLETMHTKSRLLHLRYIEIEN